MRAKLRTLHSPDVDDLRAYWPDEEGVFGFLVQAFIGSESGAGEDSFDFVVCSPGWLMRKAAAEGPIWGRTYLIMAEYDYNTLRRAVERICERAVGDTWQEVAAQLSRFTQWEFEDYRPHAGQ